MRHTPSVGNNSATLATFAKTILDAIASPRGDNERARSLRVTSIQLNHAQGKGEKQELRIRSNIEFTHLGARWRG